MGRKFLFLDTETTGAEEKDRICQLAFLSVEKEGIQKVMSYCKPPLPISVGAMAVHNITNERVAHEPIFEACEAAIKLDELNDGMNVMIIHNAPFDVGMLEKEGFLWKGLVIDTLRCSRHLLPDLQSHALQYLRYALNIYKREEEEATKLDIVISAHDALGDVFILKLLFEELFDLAKRDMMTLIDLSTKPIYYPLWRWGKYKDKKLEEIARMDPGYLDWAVGNMTLDEDWIYSVYIAQVKRAREGNERPQDKPYLLWAEEQKV